MSAARAVLLTVIATLSAPTAARAQAVPGDTITFAEALAAGLERSPRLAAARAAVDAADAARAQARAAWLPALAGSASLTRFEEPMVVAPLHGFDPQSPPEFDRSLAQGRLTVGWTVFDGGARSARSAAAGARAAGSDAGAEQATADAILAVLEAYQRLAAARDALVAQRAREESLGQERLRAQQLVDEGAAPRLELLRVEAELAHALAQGAGIRAAQTAAESELALRLGIPTAQVARAALLPVGLRGEAPPLPARVADDHPALLAARARTAAADALVRETRSAWLPRIQGTGALVEYGTAAGDFRGEWQAGLQADYALFGGGARGARVDEARAEARRAAAEEQAVADDLAAAGDRAQAALDEALARRGALVPAVARFDELARVEALALGEGAGVQADYLRALAGLFSARLGLADAERAVVLARARVAAARGTLDTGWTRTHLEGVR